MKIKDVEKRTQTDRATLYYYEKEGLLAPQRTENGYRIYDETDVEMIEKIKLLRYLHVSIEDLKKLNIGSLTLPEVMVKQLSLLQKDQEKTQVSTSICARILEDQGTFFGFHPEAYLKDSLSNDGATVFYASTEDDELPKVYEPLRRFFARAFDYLLYTVFWYLILYLLFRIDLLNRTTAMRVLDQGAVMLLMLFLEPLFLSVYRTTPGKKLLGMTLEKGRDIPLKYHEAFHRTYLVLLEGMGFLIPVVTIFTHIISYNRCVQGEEEPWDDGISYRVRDRKSLRVILYSVSSLTLVSILILLQYLYFMPPNRGNLTVEEFTENFAHYKRIYQMDLHGESLKRSGAWEDPYNFMDYYLPNHVTVPPALGFTLNDGFVTEVSFIVDVRDTDFFVYPYGDLMSLISLSLMEPDWNLLETRRKADALVNRMDFDYYNSFSLHSLSVLSENEVSFEGFEPTHNHMKPLHEAETNYYRQRFHAAKVK